MKDIELTFGLKVPKIHIYWRSGLVSREALYRYGMICRDETMNYLYSFNITGQDSSISIGIDVGFPQSMSQGGKLITV